MSHYPTHATKDYAPLHSLNPTPPQAPAALYHKQAGVIAGKYTEEAILSALAYLHQVPDHPFRMRVTAVLLELEKRP